MGGTKTGKKDPVTSAITSGGTVGGRQDPAADATATWAPKARQDLLDSLLGPARGTAQTDANGNTYTPRQSAFPTNIADEEARSDAVGLGAVGMGRPSTGNVPLDPRTGRPYAPFNPGAIDEAITNGNPVGGRQDPATAGTLTPATVPVIHGYRPPADYPTVGGPGQMGPSAQELFPSLNPSQPTATAAADDAPFVPGSENFFTRAMGSASPVEYGGRGLRGSWAPMAAMRGNS
jgi:hypothetical protein